jgi:hypothetical protein
MEQKHICGKCSKDCQVINNGATGQPLRSVCCEAEVVSYGDTSLPDPMTCKHFNFSADVRVNRDETDGVVDFKVNVSVTCRDCMTPMSFVGAALASGIKDKPHMDQMGLVVSLPCVPMADAMTKFLAARAPKSGDETLSGGHAEEPEK